MSVAEILSITSYSQLTLYLMVMCMVCFQRHSSPCFLQLFTDPRIRFIIYYWIRAFNIEKCFSTASAFYYEIRKSRQEWVLFRNKCAIFSRANNFMILWPFSFKTVISSFLALGSVAIPWRVANTSNQSLCIINWVRLFTFAFVFCFFFPEFPFEYRLYEPTTLPGILSGRVILVHFGLFFLVSCIRSMKHFPETLTYSLTLMYHFTYYTKTTYVPLDPVEKSGIIK